MYSSGACLHGNMPSHPRAYAYAKRLSQACEYWPEAHHCTSSVAVTALAVAAAEV